jgi:hypothetical protein
MSGKCYEIDQATSGNRYRVIVPSVKCRPLEVKLLWQPKESGFDGQCYEVAMTGAQNYAASVTSSKCLIKDLGSFLVEIENKFHCLKFYQGPNGEEIRQKTKDEDCKPTEGEYFFALNKDMLSGECYFISGTYRTKDSPLKCRPQELKYVWLEEKQNCYEMHRDGPEKYVAKTKPELCIEKNLETEFSADLSKLKFSCLQIFYTLNGEKSSRPLPLVKCRTKELITKFIKISPLKGGCLEIDKNQGLVKYANLLSLEKCRPSLPERDFLYIDEEQKLEDSGCFMVDKKTKGENYIEKVDKKFCAETITELMWEPAIDGWTGRCVKKAYVPDEKGDLIFKVKDCKPKETVYVWRYIKPFQGECYEVDAKEGRLLYSEKVRTDLCRPKLLSQIKYFFHIDTQGLGTCYLVDLKTNGLDYSEKVESEKCKLNL